ncbi:histidine--tRNA ligase [Candidatus Roizmanbacteria bacterium CG_4_10_14_0_8_um_filter_33_9]|uniref:Histidine--tRNA ligase n=1 Tax=Candidatus Roizmanbacteria bacterium CG_4_10_14_0_8_um_filter_33_9 TaxID=1974826 RepID=A0A2M7QIY0_9BACT|nr:MAG: histidine--tRNA ligase [Candidatus Roizmanbacteria bacterium CG_4_10_14_0_8_um_filter_33_9]
MSSIKTQTLKGFRDFLSKDAMQRQWLKNKMIEVCELWGYEPLETPTLEPLELFTGQIGEDEKLFYKFKDQGDRSVALRYDQTVPSCRVIGQYAGQLIMPYRRYQVQPVFRAEKPQKGRYREFTQFDIDIFGIASPLADAEVIALTLDIYRRLGFKTAKAVINNRDLMKNVPYTAISSIDKLKKIGSEGVIQEMIEKGIDKNKAREYLSYVQNIKPDETIKLIFEYLSSSGFPTEWYSFEPTLARSFSYSQGPIWEIVIPEYSAGSVAGGERYDKLVEKISNQKIPATGIAIGFDRTLKAAIECNIMPEFTSVSNVLVSVFSKDLWNNAIGLSQDIRRNNISVELYPDPSIKLEKQLKYANRKGIPFVLIQGPEEVEKKVIKLKNMKTGEQETMTLDQLIKKLGFVI